MNKLRQIWTNIKNKVMGIFNRQTGNVDVVDTDTYENYLIGFSRNTDKYILEHPGDKFAGQRNPISKARYDVMRQHGFTNEDMLNSGLAGRTLKQNERIQQGLHNKGIDLDLDTIKNTRHLCDIEAIDAKVREYYKELLGQGYSHEEARKRISLDIFNSEKYGK